MRMWTGAQALQNANAKTAKDAKGAKKTQQNRFIFFVLRGLRVLRVLRVRISPDTASASALGAELAPSCRGKMRRMVGSRFSTLPTTVLLFTAITSRAIAADATASPVPRVPTL